MGYSGDRPGLPPTPPFQPSDLDGQTGYASPFNLAQPSAKSAIVERYSIFMTLPVLTLFAMPANAAPYAGIPVATLCSQAMYFSTVVPGSTLGVRVHPSDILRIKRLSYGFAPAANRTILVAGAWVDVIQPGGDIRLPMVRNASDVGLRNTSLQQAALVGPIDLRGTDFNLGGQDPAIDEIDLSALIAVVDGGGNVVVSPSFMFEFEIYRGLNQ